MLSGLKNCLVRNMVVLFATIFLFIGLLNVSALINEIDFTYSYKEPFDVKWFAAFISILFWTLVSLTLEKKQLSMNGRFMMPYILAVIAWLSYFTLQLLFSRYVIYSALPYNDPANELYIQLFQMLKLFVFIGIFLYARKMLANIFIEKSIDFKDKYSEIIGLQSLAVATVSAISLFQFIPALVQLQGYVMTAVTLSVVFFLYHCYWNYDQLMKVYYKIGEPIGAGILFAQLFIMAILLVVFIVIFSHYSNEWGRNIEMIGFRLIFSLSLYIQNYTWVFFLAGVVMVVLITFFVKNRSYRIMHCAICSMLIALTFMKSSDFFVSISLLLSLYGFMCFLYGSWNRLILWLVLRNAEPSDVYNKLQ